MGLAIDTIGLKYSAGTAATSAYQALTALSGDSLTVRSFQAPAYAQLEEILAEMSTANAFRVRSPMFHDNTQGIRLVPGTSPLRWALPQETPQMLQPADTLIAEVNDATANATYSFAIRVYYSDLPGAGSRLKMPGDIAGNIKSIKPVLVTVSSSAQAWVDTLITATENLLHANTDYAVLGLLTDTNVAAVGIKGQETSNLRVCVGGVLEQYGTAESFIDLSNRHQTPHIPVFNSANAGNVYVSVLDNGSATVNVTVLLAELAHPVA